MKRVIAYRANIDEKPTLFCDPFERWYGELTLESWGKVRRVRFASKALAEDVVDRHTTHGGAIETRKHAWITPVTVLVNKSGQGRTCRSVYKKERYRLITSEEDILEEKFDWTQCRPVPRGWED